MYWDQERMLEEAERRRVEARAAFREALVLCPMFGVAANAWLGVVLCLRVLMWMLQR